MLTRLIITLATLLLTAGCQNANHSSTAPISDGLAGVSGRKISNDNCGRLAIYVTEVDSKPVPDAISGANLEKRHPLPPGKHEVVFELRRSMGWSFAPFHAQVRVQVDVQSAGALLPEVELVSDDTRKKPRTEGALWLSDSQTGKAMSAKVGFSTEGYQAPTMIFIPNPTK